MTKQQELRKEYMKQRRRIQSFMRSAKKRGFYWNTSILPPIPKRITAASIRRLSKLTAKELYKSALFLNKETGEIMSSYQGRKLLKEQRKKPVDTIESFDLSIFMNPPETAPRAIDGGVVIYNNFYDDVIMKLIVFDGSTTNLYYSGKKYRRSLAAIEESKRARDVVLSAWYALVDDKGKSAVGWMIQEKENEIGELIDAVLYASDSAHISLAVGRLINLFNQMKSTPTPSDLSVIQEDEEYDEYF